MPRFVASMVLLIVHANLWATPPTISTTQLPVPVSTSTVISNTTSGLTASVTQSVTGNTMTLTQGAPTTGRAISVIDWSSFNIGSSAQVTFIQPSVSSVVLNRVTGSTATRIDGGLLAHGQIWLLNGNGVMVGSSGNINAAGFLAGTVGISDSSFAAGFSSTTPGSNSSTGNFSFTPTCSTNCTTLGQILNQGVINATNNGYVLLGAEQVRNEGSIQADLGFIGIGAGKAFTLSFSGDRTLQFATVDQDVQLVASNTTSNLFTSLATNGSNALISNSGNLVSRGGKVALYAATALNVAQQVVNTSGLINADTVRVDSLGNVFFTINDTFSSAIPNQPPVSYGSYPTNVLYNGSIDIVGKTSANVITGDIVNSGTIRANNNFTNTATSVTPGQDQSIRLVGGTVTNTSSGMISANSLWIDPAFESSRTVSIPTTAVVSKVDIFAVNDVINSGGILANTPVGTGLISVVSNAGSVNNTSSGAIQADGFDGGFVNVITSTNGSQTNSGVISAAPLTQLNGNSATTVFANTPTLRSIFSSASAGLAGTITNQSLAVGASGLTPSTGTVPATTTSSSTATGANSTTTALKALVPISPALATLATTPFATAAPQATAPQSSSTQSPSTSTTDPSIASSKEQPTNAVAPVDAQPPATVELAQQTAVGQNPQVAVASTQQPTSVPSQQQDTKQNPSTQPPSNTSQGTPAAPVPGPSGATTLNSGPTSTVSTSSSASMPTPVPIPSSNASGLPPSAPNNAGVTLAMAKATGQPVAFVSPASVATTQLAPTPPSPVGDVKSPTPKDAADSGDKTLAAATPPSVTSASASKRSASKANTSQVGMVGVQVNGAAKAPVANAQEQRFSQIGNSASW